MTVLEVSLTELSFRRGEANFLHHFSGFKGRGHKFDKKVVNFDHALALRTDGNNFGAESDDRRGPIGCLIGVGKASANRAFIADLHVAQLRSRLRQERAYAAKKVRSLDLKVGGHGADAHLAALFPDIREIFDLADVNEQ